MKLFFLFATVLFMFGVANAQKKPAKKTAKCEWCSKTFEIKMEQYIVFGQKVSVYVGGYNCSGQNGDCQKKSSGDISALGMLEGNPPKPKYCSKRCAYDAGD